MGEGTVCVWQLIAAGVVCFPEKWNVVIAAVIKSQAGDASFFFFFGLPPPCGSELSDRLRLAARSQHR